MRLTRPAFALALLTALSLGSPTARAGFHDVVTHPFLGVQLARAPPPTRSASTSSTSTCTPRGSASSPPDARSGPARRD